MASACCVHQISSPALGSKPQEHILHSWSPAALGFRTRRFCSYKHRRLMLQSSASSTTRRGATAVARTIATTPESEVGASDTEGDDSIDAEVIDVEESDAAEEIKSKKASLRQPPFKKKSLVHILETLHKQAIEEATKDKEIPDIRPGYVVQIRLEVPETKRRVSLLRGIVICRRNNGVNTTFTIRRIFAGVGVEMVFPLYSPNIKEITVLAKKKVRRAKLYYLRKKLARFSTF